MVPTGVGGTLLSLAGPSGAPVGPPADGFGLGAPPAVGEALGGVAGFPVAAAAGEGVAADGMVAPPVEMGIDTASA